LEEEAYVMGQGPDIELGYPLVLVLEFNKGKFYLVV
jgi:hypothetical protein